MTRAPKYFVRVHDPDSLAAYWDSTILLCDVLQHGTENVTIYMEDLRGDGVLSYSQTTVLEIRALQPKEEK